MWWLPLSVTGVTVTSLRVFFRLESMMHGRSRALPRAVRWLSALCLGLAISGVAGAQILEISAAQISGAGWTAQRLHATLTTSAQGDQLRLAAGVV